MIINKCLFIERTAAGVERFDDHQPEPVGDEVTDEYHDDDNDADDTVIESETEPPTTSTTSRRPFAVRPYLVNTQPKAAVTSVMGNWFYERDFQRDLSISVHSLLLT